MADFDPPFADLTGNRRLPTTTEREEGFPCGPADRQLFNGMFHRIESEIGNVISFAGITPTDSHYICLREAIVALIAAATGGGDTSQFILLSQARARLPIWPEVLNTAGIMVVTSPAPGTVRVPAGTDLIHRGIYPFTSALTDFPTSPSKVYHLRWNATDGFNLQDLADVAYNPTAAAESNAAFDSTYDNFLLSRIVTNASNIATITNLKNKHQLIDTYYALYTTGITGPDAGKAYHRSCTDSNNWGRAPQGVNIMGIMGAALTTPGAGIEGVANRVENVVSTRYQTTYTIQTDFYAAIGSPYVETRTVMFG